MNELSNIKQTMSSREIAQLTGKRHDHVLRDCDILNGNYEKLGLPRIGEGYYTHPNTGNQQHREYLLTKMQTFDLMTGYNVELRIKVNRRWEELEKNKNQLDFSNPDTVLMIVQNWKEEKEKREISEARAEFQEKQLQLAAPKVEYYEEVINSDSLITTNTIAKELGMSAISLNRELHKYGVIYRQSGTWFLYHKYQDKGYTGTKTYTYTDNHGNTKTSIQTLWTQKGREFIHGLIPNQQIA